MPTLLLRFPGRRYHATPWGHHVNEGLIEWPPSPWRLLRALLSVGYSALGWSADLREPWRSSPPAAARSLFEVLADVAPRYRLPPATGTHSRHYMPMADFKDGRERTTLVFDTWAQIESGELAVTWDVALGSEQLAMLDDLARHLNYLGRSESWVHSRLAGEAEAAQVDYNCAPCEGTPSPGPGWEQIALLAPEPGAHYAAWREASLQREWAALPAATGRGKASAAKATAAREAANAMFPADTVASLQVDTTWLRSHGWSQPPGTRKVLYWRRSDALRAANVAPPVESDETDRAAVHAVLLALAGPTPNQHVLPKLERTLPQAELLHRQVLGAFAKLTHGRHSPTLSGCDAAGAPLRGTHGHAHVLPLDLNGDGHLDHVLLWARDGFASAEQAALRLVRSTYAKGAAGALRLAWAGAGNLDDMAGLAPPLGDVLQRTLSPARLWLSATPFVPPRYLKARGANALEGQVQAELAARGLPPALEVSQLDPQHDEQARRLRHHVRVRRFGPPPPVNMGLMLRLQFASKVSGPLCLGYGSHFGLGRFECVDGGGR